MNEAHWHLVVNHFPIILPIAGLLVMAVGLISKSEAVKRTAFMIFILASVFAFVAMSTGEGAEEIVEKVSTDAENYIESHEEMAETFALLSYFLGGVSLFGLWASFKQKSFSFMVSVGTFAYALVVLFFAKQTGTTGGEIRHPEIRTETILSEPVNQNSAHEEDD